MTGRVDKLGHILKKVAKKLKMKSQKHISAIYNLIILREDTHKKKVFFLVVGPLRGGRGVTPPTTKQKTTFFSINGENSPGSFIMKILFYEVRHLVQIFPKVYTQFCLCIFLLVRVAWTTKPLGGGLNP